MRLPKIQDIRDVVDWRLCLGCGVCVYACPENQIELVNIIDEGLRPVLRSDACTACTTCLDVCPGYDYSSPDPGEPSAKIEPLAEGWGSVLEIWEGYPADPEIHYQGSSAGMATALALYCLEQADMSGVLHIVGDQQSVFNNTAVMSHSRADLLAATGSRYAPAAPCEGLELFEEAPAPGVFIGKPCDVVAVRKVQSIKPILKEKIGITIGIFCAGTPATRGTMNLLEENGIDPTQVEALRYRGRGWPGQFTARLKGAETADLTLPYATSWGFLQHYRPFRCHLCPDGTSEAADIACGDPWYRPTQDGEIGSSLVVVRTERGKRIVREAMAAGYIHLQPGTPEMLIQSQHNLLAKRSHIWGRRAALQVLGRPAPRLPGYSLFQLWWRLSLKEKVRSVLGTLRRIIQRGYYKPLNIQSMERLKSGYLSAVKTCRDRRGEVKPFGSDQESDK